MVLGTLAASLVGNIMAGKGGVKTGYGFIGAGEGTNRTGQDF